MVENAMQPVAWQYRIINRFGETEWTNCSLLEFDHFQKQDDDPFFGRYEVRPLYASPQPSQQPLTDEQIQAAIIQIDSSGVGCFLHIARAIEAAHGITKAGGAA